MLEFIIFASVGLITLVILRFILRSKIASNVWEQHATKNPVKKWLLWNVRSYLPKILFWFHCLALLSIFVSAGIFFPAYYANNLELCKTLQTTMLVVAVLSVCFIDMARRYKTY